jgi:hypothetical protein
VGGGLGGAEGGAALACGCWSGRPPPREEEEEEEKEEEEEDELVKALLYRFPCVKQSVGLYRQGELCLRGLWSSAASRRRCVQ